MRISTLVGKVFITLTCLLVMQVNAEEQNIHHELSDALVCKGDPAGVVHKLARRGSNFKAGYAVYGFGDGASYKTAVVFRKPLQIGNAKTYAIVSETENSHFDFRAFTYARFEGDYHSVVKLLNLEATKPFTELSLGKFISQQPQQKNCPPTITLTPVDKAHFLLGCGWCNG